MNNSYEIVGIIPARYASVRFPGKLLKDLNGKSVLQHVYDQCCKAELLDKIIIATDDPRIEEHVIAFGGAAMMTPTHIDNGTSRCVYALQSHPDLRSEFVINIQADEPLVHPQEINALAQALLRGDADIVTLVTSIPSAVLFDDPNVVKVVLDHKGKALYFSRQPVPHTHSFSEDLKTYQHIGLYGFRTQTLMQISQLPPSPLERTERLEQLRWLENGHSIQTIYSDNTHIGIDTPRDLERAKAHLRTR